MYIFPCSEQLARCPRTDRYSRLNSFEGKPPVSHILGFSERGLIGHSSSIQPNSILEVIEIQGRPAKTTSHAFDNENHSSLD